jgi:hypothetical protein
VGRGLGVEAARPLLLGLGHEHALEQVAQRVLAGEAREEVLGEIDVGRVDGAPRVQLLREGGGLAVIGLGDPRRLRLQLLDGFRGLRLQHGRRRLGVARQDHRHDRLRGRPLGRRSGGLSGLEGEGRAGGQDRDEQDERPPRPGRLFAVGRGVEAPGGRRWRGRPRLAHLREDDAADRTDRLGGGGVPAARADHGRRAGIMARSS